MNSAEHRNFLWVLLLIFISRLPFVNAGYGAEEDAWAMRLVTERIATTGQYEVSRLPWPSFTGINVCCDLEPWCSNL